MRIKNFVIALLLQLISFNAFAYRAHIDGFYYNFWGEEAIVTYSDYSSSYRTYNNDAKYSSIITIPESVTYDGKTYSVTTIGMYAFEDCSKITSIIIPNSVTTIEDQAFCNCIGLTSINLPSSLINLGKAAFYNCSALTSINIPDGVTSIEDGTFYGCNSLSSIIIPESVVSIGNQAFSDTPWWNQIYSQAYGRQEWLIYIGKVAFFYVKTAPESTITLKEGTLGIAGGAFSDCRNLISITIPESVTNIGKEAFRNCRALTSVSVSITDYATFCNNKILYLIYNAIGLPIHLISKDGNEISEYIIPDGVTNIGSKAFYNCCGMTSVIIPNSVKTIGFDVFENCIGLTSLTIPNSVTSIDVWAFKGCSSLTSITIPESVTSIGESAFQGCSSLTNVKVPVMDYGSFCNSNICSLINTAIGQSVHLIDNAGNEITTYTIPENITSIGDFAFCNCTGLTFITIPESVTSIGNGAFDGCVSLNKIKIPEGVKVVDNYTFDGCCSLSSINIPESVTSIGERAFNGCSNLTSITIPQNVSNIGDQAFNGCKLRNLLIKCTTPPTVTTSSFSEQTYYHTTLYVPADCWDAYAYDDNWYKFSNIREIATLENQVSEQLVYTLMDANTFEYSVYDPVNDCIGTIRSVAGINEDNPNHNWQVIRDEQEQYLYNIGAKKYAIKGKRGLELSDIPTPIEMRNGENGIILGGQKFQQWALVANESMNNYKAIITGITPLLPKQDTYSQYYDICGRMLRQPAKGLNIIHGKKVIIK